MGPEGLESFPIPGVFREVFELDILSLFHGVWILNVVLHLGSYIFFHKGDV